MKLDEAVEKLKKTGAVKIDEGNIWFMTLPGGEKMLAIKNPAYSSSLIIEDESQLKTKLHFLLNRAEMDSEGEISISGDEIRM